MREQRRAIRWTGLLLTGLLTGLLTAGCGPTDSLATSRDSRNATTAAEPGEWRHLVMDDIEVDFAAFQPIRARYLQVMYDMDLLGRANLMMGEDGNYRLFREFLGLVDWTVQPLPLSDYADPAIWDLDLAAGTMRLDPGQTPPVLVPLRP